MYQCILFFPRSMRLADYRLGKRHRRVIPSCVVASIRSNSYPDAAGNYTGFKDTEESNSLPG